ncbi:MAG TPA: hypothetical protein DCR43_08840 [Bacteroidales bacterium]|nr:MAG: hypothetical protein A2X11_04280 [Bacteroidetes bacterium GWE2_42_24]OFY25254.1 MAG: hypothetical protein A2X09_11015 [Bacteroidetes bacterium GWF2_43_11]PKP18734.1 MAG: hypothetical protein CVU06_11940 [Bacteroidetes bacterium HGW-Bacteroidetes-22]HAQ65940.1 hypothetical protein [Bacteroidales bacterium]HBZ66956.1 hypothetical protein [Bacteroidales bacterium]
MKELPNPKLIIKPARADCVIEVLGWVVLGFLWSMTIWAFTTVSGDVPVHFNFRGEVDGYGSIGFIVWVPGLTTLMLAGITWLNHYPHIFNYPVKITAQNAQKQYAMATRFLRILKLSIAVISFIINLSIITTATGISVKPGFWLTPLIIIIVFLPFAIYLSKSFRQK